MCFSILFQFMGIAFLTNLMASQNQPNITPPRTSWPTCVSRSPSSVQVYSCVGVLLTCQRHFLHGHVRNLKQENRRQ